MKNTGIGGLGGSPQQVGYFIIGRIQPFPGIKQKEDDVGLVDGLQGLAANCGLHAVVAVRLDPAGIDQDKVAVVPGHPFVVAITGDARRRIYDRLAGLCNPVEEGGFADIGPADQGDYGIVSGVVVFTSDHGICLRDY